MVRKESSSGLRNGARGLGQVLLLVATVDVGLIACGRSNVWFPGDAYEGVGNDAGKGGSAGKGGLAAGGSGGSVTTGGTGGSVTTGGSGGGGYGGTISSGGFPLGGMGGSAAGAAGAAGAGPGPFACPSVPVTCDTFTNFSTAAFTTFGSGTFTGGVAVYGEGLVHTDGPEIHVTGTVSDYGSGILLWFTHCSDLSAFEGVTFTADGSTSFGNNIEFMALTNSDYPWQPRPGDEKGGCTASDPDNAWAECLAPNAGFILGPMPQVLYWGGLSGGTPVPWDAATSPRELVGLQWHFPYNPGFGSYTVDVTIDDVSFIGGGANDCGPGPGAGGMGGMGGIGGIGGIGGFAGSAGSSGMPGSGAGGMPSAGAGGMSGAGGSSGAGFGGGGFSGGAGTSGGGLSGSAGAGGTSAGEGGLGGEGGA